MATQSSMLLAGRSGDSSALQPDAQPAQEICIANISPRERQKRLLAGGVEFLAGLLILALLIRFGVNPAWRLGLFIPFFGAAVGWFQWRDKT